ncbi:hypothetical protein MMC13_000080 [Lambiella insularis]|nr:hypothetical protein [Lambiella insularis]
MYNNPSAFGMFARLLPAELRTIIWRHLLTEPEDLILTSGRRHKIYTALLRTCRQAYEECTPVLYASNTLVIRIHQSQRIDGLHVAPRWQRYVDRIYIQVMVDYKGPTTSLLSNVFSARLWLRNFGKHLQEVVIVLHEGTESTDDADWMPGLRNEVLERLIAIRAPLVILELSPALLQALEPLPSRPAPDLLERGRDLREMLERRQAGQLVEGGGRDSSFEIRPHDRRRFRPF